MRDVECVGAFGMNSVRANMHAGRMVSNKILCAKYYNGSTAQSNDA